MTTLRVEKRDRWTSVDRRAINDARLSFRARGVLVWLLDKPDDWRCDSRDISRQGKEGRDAVRAALTELEDIGYLHRNKTQSDDGKWHTEVVIRERPVDNAAPMPGNPASVSQTSVFQALSKKTEPKTEIGIYPQDGHQRMQPPRPYCEECDGTTRRRLDDGRYSHETCESCA